MHRHNHQKKYRLLTILIVVLSVFLLSCSTNVPPDNGPGESIEDLTIFTLEDLSQYDGKDGRKAYVAVDGLVYDLTNSRPWSGGNHNSFTAGQDLTHEIMNVSPHGVSKLKNIPIVGRLESTED